MSQPDFRVLPPVVGVDGYRWVGSTMMNEEQYRVERWYLSGPLVKPSEHSYEVDHPTRGPMVVSYWRAPLPWSPEKDAVKGKPTYGLRGYALLIEERKQKRIAEAQTRRESDDQWSEHINSLLDSKPNYPGGTA